MLFYQRALGLFTLAIVLPLSACAVPLPCTGEGDYVLLVGPNDRTVRFEVELAHTPPLREKGLMHRTDLPQNTGMLFLWPDRAHRVFWMKNTPLPLDMLFIDGDTVVGIVENATPFTQTPRAVDHPATAVLEVHGGLSATHGIKAGWRMLSCLQTPVTPLAD